MKFMKTRFSGAVSVVSTAALVLSAMGTFPLLAGAATAPTPLANPALPNSCGLDIAIVIDKSGSMAPALTQEATDLHAFVNALLPATPTEFSVTKFDTNASLVSGFTNNVTTVNSAIDSALSVASNKTNWQQGLTVAQSTFDPRTNPNLVIFISDGNPNETGNPGSSATTANALNAAITVANSIKTAQNARILAIGVTGNGGLDLSNLEAISGPNANTGNIATSDVVTGDVTSLAASLASVATQLCGGTITVHKVIDRDGNLETTDDQSPASGWAFTLGGDITNSGDANQTTDVNGDTAAVAANGTVSVTENADGNPSGYTLVGASCTGSSGSNGDPLSGNTVNNITVGNTDVVSCTFYNKPASATVNIVKVVNNNLGGNAVPSDFTFSVAEATTSQANPFTTQTDIVGADSPGTSVTLPGDTSYVVSEENPGAYVPSYSDSCSGAIAVGDTNTCTVTNSQIPDGMAGLTVVKVVVNDYGTPAAVSSFPLSIAPTTGPVSVTSGQSVILDPTDGPVQVSESGNDPTQYAESFSDSCPDGVVTLQANQSVTCVITNTAIAPTLTLVKQVSGEGPANASDWTLTATGDQQSPDVISGVTGDTSVTGAAVSAGTYTLSEEATGSDDTSNYTPSDWVCSPVSTNDDGTVTLGLGQSDTCTITNTYNAPSTPDVTISKTVDNTTPNVGGTVNYTITVNNIGSIDAPDLTVSDVLPNGVTYALDDSAGAYDPVGGVWTISDLAPDSSATLRIAATVDGDDTNGQVIDNVAAISPSTQTREDSNSSDASLTVTIPPPVLPNGCGAGTLNNECGGGGGGGGGNGPISGSIGGGAGNGPVYGQVLGAATTSPGVLGVNCGPLLSTYMRWHNHKNDSGEVTKLQQFLNDEMNANLPLTGFFGPLTDAAVKAFQQKYADQVLTPWGLNGPTGFVYKTTQREVNLLYCSSLDIPLPTDLTPYTGQ